MHVRNLWHPGLRVVEVGAVDGALAESLVQAGYQQYLAVVPCRRALAKIAANHPGLQARLTVADASQAVRANNAEVLILRGRAALQLARFRRVRHAHYVALPARPTPSFVLALVLGVVQWMLGRLARPAIVRVARDDGSSFRLVALGVRGRHARTARRYIPHALGMERLLRRLNRQHVRYVVLRWFDTLPALPAGEDLDLLVDDADLATVWAMLDEGPGLQPVNVYSVSGLPGADYWDMPLFPPQVSRQILDRACPQHDLCWAPSPEDHFPSLAYHAVYHAAEKSGIASRQAPQEGNRRPQRDDAATLAKLARRLGLDVPIVLEDLDRWLDERGWRPPREMFVQLARRNPRIRGLLNASPADGADACSPVVPHPQQVLPGGGDESMPSRRAG